MAGPKPTTVELMPEERVEVERLVRAHSTTQQVAPPHLVRYWLTSAQEVDIAPKLECCCPSPLARKLLRRRAFTSVEDLTAQVFAFIAYAKRTKARPSHRPATGSCSLSKRRAIEAHMY